VDKLQPDPLAAALAGTDKETRAGGAMQKPLANMLE
jgi:hypothetical protein